MTAFQGIVLALLRRGRTGRGRPRGGLAAREPVAPLAYHNATWLLAGETPTRLGNRHPNLAPYETFEAADGYVIVGVGTTGSGGPSARASATTRIATDPRFATNPDRVRQAAALREILVPRLVARTRRDVARGPRGDEGVPCGRVRTIPEALESAQVAARGLLLDVTHPTLGAGRYVGSPIHLTGRTAATGGRRRCSASTRPRC